MKSAFTAFERNIQELRWFIRSLELERSALTLLRSCDVVEGDHSNTLAEWVTHLTGRNIKRRFDYNSIVITLYGLLEQYIESLVCGYTRHLNDLVPTFAELPDAVKNAHVDLSTALIARLKQSRYKGGSTEASVISNLHSCLAGSGPYQLNHDAFMHHTSNFRLQSINEIFGRIGVLSVAQRVSSYDPLSEYLATQFPGRDVSGIPAAETFFMLDDLAERRNEVAHGNVTQLLGFDLLLDYVAFIEAFGRALYDLIFSSGLTVSVQCHGIELGPPIIVHNHSIVCMALKNVGVKVGDLLIARTGQSLRPLLHGEILEIQVDHQAVDEVTPQPSINVAMKVQFRTNGNHSFALLPKSA